MTDILVSKDDGQVVTLTLNDAPANCLTMEMMSAIKMEIDRVNQSKDHKLVIFESSNEKIFCSGHSFNEVQEMIKNNDMKSQELLFAECSEMLMKIRKSPKIFVAKVRGIATAGGLGLVSIMDCVFSSKSARFALGGINFNFGCHQPSVSVARATSPKNVMELLVSGQPLNAQRAQEAGLINEYLEDDALDKRVEIFSKQVCDHTPEVLALTKETLYKQSSMNISDAYDFASKAMVENLQMPETKKGIDTFLNKS
ncbi:enoyl-CoA hydratase-related protein [Pelagibacteraceae bacterium]|nr:enoyl-CoA hydratase-related protein [Pelagibacteraceae bacterium]|tara:strand:- start:264 stop:1028 length:765 start_codon:yes stop_codon:yes gene_type:complete